VKRAKTGAAQRLRDSECLKLLTDFRDSDGRTLDRRLETWGISAGLNSRFAKVQLERPSISEFMIIHEMLHRLGLSENPPTSFEITEQVSRRCH
jgi:hypothetical protein